MTTTQNFSDVTNDANRHIIQAKAVLATLTYNDIFAELDANTVSGALWVITEALEGTERSVQKMFDHWKAEHSAAA